MPSPFAPSQLHSIAASYESRVAGRRRDASLRRPVTIWHVVVDGQVFVRSVRGSESGWFSGVSELGEGTFAWSGGSADVAFTRDDGDVATIDAAYIAKYGRNSYTASTNSALAHRTTLRVSPLAG